MIRTVLEKIKGKSGEYSPKKIKFDKFQKTMKRGGFEGIVLMGAGGSLNQWIEGITDLLNSEEIIKTKNPKDVFIGAYELTTSGGRTDLALVFNTTKPNINIGKMAVWRLKFGDTSWISDYITNYADQHNI